MKGLVFISSVQNELQAERYAVRDFITSDPLLSRFFDVFLFEDVPALDRNVDDVYLDKIDECRVYLGIFGKEYGTENDRGISPTEIEFNRATKKGKPRFIFIKGDHDARRHPKMNALIRKSSKQLVRRRFHDTLELNAQVYASLITFLEQKGFIHNLPFDASSHDDSDVKDISQEKMEWFLRKARAERNYPLSEKASVVDTLLHLNLMEKKYMRNAAILLFGKQPQRFFPAAEVKCLHYHGTEVRKPIASYQIFKGTLFDQADQALDFVLTKLKRTVTPRDHAPESDTEYEIPYKSLREAIINAIAHRDYTSNASVQILIFADRIEVWNPGHLPSGLLPEHLRVTHTSIPANPLIAEPLYLAHYIEKAGTGTLDMISLCHNAGLPEPEFEQQGEQFVVTIWRDWLTTDVITTLKLNDRQKKIIQYLKVNTRITNTEYQALLHVAKRTAHRDLIDLVRKSVVRMIGTTGKGTHYSFDKRVTKKSRPSNRKGVTKGSKGSRPSNRKGVTKGSKGSRVLPHKRRGKPSQSKRTRTK